MTRRRTARARLRCLDQARARVALDEMPFPARDAALQTGMKDGVNQSFTRLEEYLQTLA